MVMKRIIPCLDVKNGRVVKGVQFEQLRDSGDPVELAARYDALGADELVLLDITAGIENRDTTLEVVEAVAKRVFIPFTVGGGVRSAEDAAMLLLSGCDKVSINTAAIRQPDLISNMANRFGNQCVVVAVDIRYQEGCWRVMVDAGRTPTEWLMEDWLREAERRGAGEILLTSMDRDGGNQGYDLEALRRASKLGIPLIASGGFGHPGHAVEAIRAGADAVLLASALHEGRVSIKELKDTLSQEGMEIRQC